MISVAAMSFNLQYAFEIFDVFSSSLCLLLCRLCLCPCCSHSFYYPLPNNRVRLEEKREKKTRSMYFFSPLLHRSFASIIKYTMMTYYDDRQLTYDACEFISFSNRKYALEDLARIESEELIIS